MRLSLILFTLSVEITLSPLGIAAEVFAKECGAELCRYIVLRNGALYMTFSHDNESGVELGPYLEAKQDIVDLGEAATGFGSSVSGNTLVVSVGFDGKGRPLPTHFLYVLDSSGNRLKKIKGDLFLDRMEFGPLFGGPDDFLLFDQRGERSGTYTTVLIQLKGREVKQRLFVAGEIECVSSENPKGILVSFSGERRFYRWIPSTDSLRRRSATDLGRGCISK